MTNEIKDFSNADHIPLEQKTAYIKPVNFFDRELFVDDDRSRYKMIFHTDNKHPLPGSWNSPRYNSMEEIPRNNLWKQHWRKKSIDKSRRCGVIFIDRSNIDLPGFNFADMKFLVVRGKDSGIWSFPKGRAKYEETDECCALRELYEETGIRLYSLRNLRRITIGRNIYFIFFTSQNLYKNFTIHDSKEIGEVSWKSYMELGRMMCNKDLRAILRYPSSKCYYHRTIYGKKGFQYYGKPYWNFNYPKKNVKTFL